MRAPPSDERGRRPAQPTPSSSPLTDSAKDDPILTEGWASGEITSEIGELLRLWVGVKLDQIDDLVAEAEAKTAALPDLRVLRQLTGETVILLYALQTEVADLKAEIRSLKARVNGRRRP